MNLNHRFFTFLGLAMTPTLMVGCGGSLNPSDLVEQLGVQTYSDDFSGDAYLELEVQLNQNYALFDLQIPVTKDGVEIGHVSIHDKNQVSLAANLSEIAGMETIGNVLPNGDPIPVSGIDSSDIVSLPAGDNIDIYVAASNGFAMAGFAIKISAFDKFLGQYVGQLTFCNNFESGGSIEAMSCIFSGPKDDTSGIAVFAETTEQILELSSQDASLAAWSGLLDSPARSIAALGSVSGLRGASLKEARRDARRKLRREARRRGEPVPTFKVARFAPEGISSSKRKKVDKGLLKFHKKYKNKRISLD